MGKTLYLECASGISGDMTVAALLDLGADREELLRVLESLPVGGFEIEIKRVKKSGLDACDFSVILDKEHENHDHDMEYLYGHEYEHGHDHDHDHEHGHGHDHDHEHGHGHIHDHEHEQNHDHEYYSHGLEYGHEHENSPDHKHEYGVNHDHGYSSDHDHEHGHSHGHAHAHEHRGLKEIMEIIEKTRMRPGAKELAVKIFRILAAAEAKAHGVPLDEVHFHEVGAVDSIADIVAAAVCFDSLGITDVIIPQICEGTGMVRCQHGLLPVPVPAVVNIVSDGKLPLHITDTYGELVTPTGAAFAAAVRTGGVLPECFTIEKVGLGAGKRTYERPGLLRAMLITPGEKASDLNGPSAEEDRIFRLESNIDDCSGEVFGHLMELLLKKGARDVYYTPIYMKKNRPACELSVICSQKDVSALEEIIFRETTTIGIRRMELERRILPREIISISTPFGQAEVKVCTLPDGEKRYYPEYDSAARLAEKNGVSLLKVMEEIRLLCGEYRGKAAVQGESEKEQE